MKKKHEKMETKNEMVKIRKSTFKRLNFKTSRA